MCFLPLCHRSQDISIPLIASGNFYACVSFVCSFSAVITHIVHLNINWCRNRAFESLSSGPLTHSQRILVWLALVTSPPFKQLKQGQVKSSEETLEVL